MNVTADTGTAVVIGAPGLLSAWAGGVVREIAAHTEPSADVLWIDRGDEVPAQDPARRRLLLSHFPSSALIDLVGSGRVRVVFLIDDPVDVVWLHREVHGVGLLEALRTITACFTASDALRRHGNPFCVYRGAPEPIRAIVWYLSQYLGLTLTPAAFASVLSIVAAPGDPDGLLPIESTLAARQVPYAPPQRAAGGDTETQVSAEDCDVIAQVLDPLVSLSLGHPPLPLTWPPSVLLSGDRPNTPVAPLIDAVGPARVIAYGPYFSIPPGIYDITLTLSPSQELVPALFSLEFHAEKRLARVMLDFQKPGLQSARFAIEHHHAPSAIEVRLRAERGVLEGSLELHGFSLLPRASTL